MIFFYAIPLLGAAAVFFCAIALLPKKSALRRTLDSLSSSEASADDTRTARAFNAILSKERKGRIAQQLVEAGWYEITPTRMMMRMASYAGVGGAAALFFVYMLHASLGLSLVMLLLFAGGGAYLPYSAMQRAIKARKNSAQKALPDFLDMVATTVQAGLSINAALAYAIDAAPGPLGEEVKLALSEIRMGRPRADALRSAAERLAQAEFTATIGAIIQAERLGTNISKMLCDLADETREHRITLVEEHAAKLPVKMVVPMALFMLPSIFVVIFGALAANYLTPK